METMDTEDQAHMQGGPSAYARRARHRHNEDRAQGAYRRLPLRGSGDRSQRNRRQSKEEEQCIGDRQDRQTGPEVEEQCRRDRNSSRGTGVLSKQDSKEEEQCVRGRAPETQVGLSGYSMTIKLRDDSGWRSWYVLSQVSADLCGHSVQRWLGTISIDTTVMMTPRSGVSVDDDEIDNVGGKVGGIDTSVHVTSDAAPALSPESTFFIEYCAGGPSSATPVLLSCVASSDTAPPPRDLLAGLLYTAPPPSTGDAMVRYSDKQALLNDIVHTLEFSIPAEIEQNADRVQHSCSTDIDDLEDDGDPLPLSRHLVRLYTFICKQRYTITRYNPLGRTDKLIHLLNRYESSNHRMYRGLVRMSPDTQELRRTRRTNQQEYELDLATATQGMSQYAVSRLRSSAAHDLREEMFQALFRSTGRNEEDTTALSRRHEKTTVDYNAMTQSTSARRWEQALTQPFSI
ncbi:uncharacterized protein UHOD_12196 [Ustilago sp. UG-2017b]|nr:uncharacterized protein UHOD_12196 [Ustilago sp. UG-2017b]